ncbi:MAG: TetR/AcrR family transcriptional regulator [Flavobacteriaceae bacterium]|nr:TetR/AcrR family transcriptional regulator [Flavobacteriaceae bacterium]
MDENFLEKVSELFILNGAKTLTMDDIAQEFGISKKTLYQHYKTKENLLEDVLSYKLNEVIEKLTILESTIVNAVERMFCRDSQIEKAVQANNSILIRQLIKYYPTIFSRHIQTFSSKFTEVLVNNIKRGREQGFYHNDFNSEMFAQLYFQLIMSYDFSAVIDTSSILRRDFQENVMWFYMQAITTEKGKLEMNRILQKSKKN